MSGARSRPETPPGATGARGVHARSSGRAAAAPGDDRRAQAMLDGLRASGLKLTPQRMAIVREIAGDPTHPTAQELFDRLRPSLPTMSFATVYNTLDALASAELCRSLALSPGPARFDPNMGAHHHAVCDRCGLVRDVPGGEEPAGSAARRSAAARATPPLGAVPGFRVRAIERIYRGFCTACVKAEAPMRSTEGEKRTWPRRSSKAPRPIRT